MPDERCPTDAVLHLYRLLGRYPTYTKAGLGIRIDDLPDCYEFAEYVRRYEKKYWRRPIERGVYHAKVDTTFALYRARVGYEVSPAIRTGSPYVLRHLPWYSDSQNPTDEERHYWAHTSMEFSNWGADEMSARMRRARRPMPNPYKRLRWWAYKRFKLRRAV